MSATILCVVGARPNFMKIAPIIRAFKQHSRRLNAYLLHTGQHYDKAMNDQLFEQLDIPRPDAALEVGSATHAVQTAEIMKRFEPILDQLQPKAVLVVGDVNSTIACGLVAVKKSIPVVHVEAGLRSFDRLMPEEINRVLTDQLSDVLFTTERDALNNLQREGIAAERVHFVGNVMIDTLLANRQKAVPAEQVLKRIDHPAIGSGSGHYGVLTLHRPSNVDNHVILHRLLQTISELSQSLPIIFPVHPRTATQIDQAGLNDLLTDSNVIRLAPLGYLELLGLMEKAKVVLTDSGGIQEETTALGIPCITLRENTERPITVDQGTNTIVGTDARLIRDIFNEILRSGGKNGRVPELWDGHAAERIVKVLEQYYA